MKFRQSLSCFAVAVAALTMSVVSDGVRAFADPVPAQSADRFVDSIGVCTHWGYPDTPYGFAYEQVRQKLVESGIRHVRDGLMRPIEVERVKELGKLGIQTCVLGEPEVGTPVQIRDKVKAIHQEVPGAIGAVEGPNEPDLFWVSNKKSYQGKSGANGAKEAVEAAVLFHKDLYTAMKGDPATRDIPVIGIALGKAYDPGGNSPNPLPAGSLTSFVDWGNFHPYFGGNPFSLPFAYGTIEKYLWDGTHPSTNMDEYPYALNTYHPPYAPKPMAATEAGCATDTNGTSAVAHGKYIPRMFLEYFRKGIVRTYSYEFVDEFPDANNREARFGLLRRDLSPKPAYTALKNLIGLLSDPAQKTDKPFTPKALDFTLAVSPVGEWTRTQYVHSLLLQKRNGDYYLLLWHEVANEDKSVTPRRQIQPPPMPATLTLNTPVSQDVEVYEWDEQGKMTSRSARLTAKRLSVNVPDRVLAIRLRPTGP
ncbi:MAG: hypothetical protein OHK0029_18050 [Armatimonadaceae bacterium]